MLRPPCAVPPGRQRMQHGNLNRSAVRLWIGRRGGMDRDMLTTTAGTADARQPSGTLQGGSHVQTL